MKGVREALKNPTKDGLRRGQGSLASHLLLDEVIELLLAEFREEDETDPVRSSITEIGAIFVQKLPAKAGAIVDEHNAPVKPISKAPRRVIKPEYIPVDRICRWCLESQGYCLHNERTVTT